MKNKLPHILASRETPSKLMMASIAVSLVAAAGEGKRPTFTMNAYNGGTMMLAGWWDPVVVDLAGVKKMNANIPALRQHDFNRVVGHCENVDISPVGINAAGVISGTGPDADEVAGAARNGFPWQASIGASPDRIEYLEAGSKATVNGKEITGPATIVRECTLYEISFVPVGADMTTSTTVTANFTKENSMEFDAWLKANGFDKSKLTSEQVKTLEAMFTNKATDAAIIAAIKSTWKIEAAAPSTAPTAVATSNPADVVAAQNAALATNAERVNKITLLCGTKHPDLLAQAIRENWDVTKVELEVMRAERPKAPAGVVPETGITAAVMEAAVCVAGGLAAAEKSYDAKTLQLAHDHFRSRISLQELLLQAAWRNGYTGRTYRGNEREILRAAFSSVDIANILSNVANKFLLEGWMSVEDSWKQIAAIRPVNDFKQVTSYRLTSGLEYEEVAPDGRLKHGELANDSYTNQAKTYGKMLAITRQDQINDDLGSLTNIPKLLGRGGALKFNKVFWAMFMNNSSYFTAGRGNYQEGSGTVLSIDSLTAAELLFLNQTDSDPTPSPLGIAPEILLTPNALSTKATSLTRDTEIRDTTASTKYTTANPHAGKFRPVRSSYLSNAAITGYSTTAWYLLANPATLAVIEACFLNGQQNPTVESANADFDVLGIQLRGYHDFGVNLQEYRAGVKSKGSA
jgi:hypothetical protein